MKDAARDVAFGQDGGLFRQLDLFERLDELEVAGAMRLGHALKLAPDEFLDDRTILRQLMFPPAYRQVAAKRLAVVPGRADDGGFEIEALLHGWPTPILRRGGASGALVGAKGSMRRKPRWKSKVRRKWLRKFPPIIPVCSNPAVSLMESISSTAAVSLSRSKEPKETRGSISILTLSATPAEP